MTENKFDAKADQIKGTVKEGLGKLTGNKETETEGIIEKNTGKVKEILDDAEGIVKGAFSRVKEAVEKDKKD